MPSRYRPPRVRVRAHADETRVPQLAVRRPLQKRDTGRNGYGATFAAAYTVRARRAPVSAPCTWEDIERGEVHPTSFTLPNMLTESQRSVTCRATCDARARSLKRPMKRVRALDGRT
jgi:DNA primase